MWNGGHFCSGEIIYGCSFFAREVVFFIKNISSSHRKGTFHYTTEYEGPLSQHGFSNPHCCTDVCLVILNIYVQIYASQIYHPYDIDTCTIKEQCLSLEMLNLEIVLYHTLRLYVEYAVLCGNKVLLNLNFNLNELIRPACPPMRSINSFHNRLLLLLHH